MGYDVMWFIIIGEAICCLILIMCQVAYAYGKMSKRSTEKAVKKLYRQYKKEQRQVSTDGEAVASAIISSVIVRGV